MVWETVAKCTVRGTLVYTTCTKPSGTVGRGTNVGRELLALQIWPFPLDGREGVYPDSQSGLLCELLRTHEAANQKKTG